MNKFKLKYRRSGVHVKTIEINTLERYEDKNITLEFNSLPNNYGNRIMVIVKPKVPVIIEECSFTFDMLYEYKTITTNGYQSSSESLESDFNFKLKNLSAAAKMFSLSNFGDYTSEKYLNKGILSHTFIHFNKEDGKNIRFYGSINEETAFTIFSLDNSKNSMSIYSDCKDRLIDENFTLMDFIIAEGNERKVYDHYLNFFPQKSSDEIKNNIWITPHKTSQKIKPLTLEELQKDLNGIKNSGIDINTIIISDSFFTKIGDFSKTDEKRFPSGMKAAADKIKENGFKAGIWLAPFIAERKSELYKKHPDWFLKKVFNFKVSGGYNPDWSSKFYILDIYNPDVFYYITDMFKTVMYEWGFEVLYIDYIYAAAIEARIDKTRAEILKDVTNFINNICKDKTIIAASVPLGSSFGKYDNCKACVDNAPFWEDNVMKKFGYRERVSTLNALNTLISRRHLNKNMINSVSSSYFIGSEDTHLSLLEKQTLLTVSSILSSCVIVSDKIDSYDDIEMQLLKKIFPNPDVKNISHNESDNIHTFEFTKNGSSYLVISNFNNADKEYIIPKGIYCGKYGALLPSKSALNLKAHQTHILVKIDMKKSIQPIYSDAHILPLFEIEKIKHDTEGNVSIDFKKSIKELGDIYIIAPNENLKVNGVNCRLVQNYGKRSIFVYETEDKNNSIDEFKIQLINQNAVKLIETETKEEKNPIKKQKQNSSKYY